MKIFQKFTLLSIVLSTFFISWQTIKNQNGSENQDMQGTWYYQNERGLLTMQIAPMDCSLPTCFRNVQFNIQFYPSGTGSSGGPFIAPDQTTIKNVPAPFSPTTVGDIVFNPSTNVVSFWGSINYTFSRTKPVTPSDIAPLFRRKFESILTLPDGRIETATLEFCDISQCLAGNYYSLSSNIRSCTERLMSELHWNYKSGNEANMVSAVYDYNMTHFQLDFNVTTQEFKVMSAYFSYETYLFPLKCLEENRIFKVAQ